LGPFTTRAGSVSPPDDTAGVPLTLAAVALVITALVRGWRPARLFWASAATLLTIWVAASLSDVHMLRPPNDLRYLSTNAALLFVCICAALSRPQLPRAGVAAALVVLGILSATNASHFGDTRAFLQASDTASRAQLGALLVLRGIVPGKFSPAPPGPPGLIESVTAGPFFSAVDSFGVIADSVSSLERRDKATRRLADAVLVRGAVARSSTAPANLAPAIAPPAVLSGNGRSSGACVTFAAARLGVRLPPGTYALKAALAAPLSMKLARFSSLFATRLRRLPPGETAYITVRRDRAPQVPWRALLEGSGEVCALAGP
jgi:hypothetical protein